MHIFCVADGHRFLWVSLQLKDLAALSILGDDDTIREALLDLPVGLNDTYFQILQRIELSHAKIRSHALKALRWVLFARRPLLLEELYSALNDTDGDGSMERMSIDSVNSILALCSNLLVKEHLERHQSTQGRGKNVIVVRPVHFSVQQYLTGGDTRLHSLHSLSEIFDATLANGALASACLSRLTQHIMHTETPVWSWNGVMAEDALIFYAAEFFDQHVSSAQKLLDNGTVKDRVSDLLEGSQNLLRNILFLQLEQSELMRQVKCSKYIANLKGPLAAILVDATLLGTIHVIREQYATSSGTFDAFAVVHSFGDPHAAERLLPRLSKHVDVKMRDNQGRTALRLAVDLQERHCARMLIERGANPDSRDYEGISILERCVETSSDLNMVRLLLEHGASLGLNHEHSTHKNALQHAACRVDADTSYSLISLLIECGADVNAGSRQHDDALSAAARGRNLRAVELLLQHGAKVNVSRDSSSPHPDFRLTAATEDATG